MHGFLRLCLNLAAHSEGGYRRGCEHHGEAGLFRFGDGMCLNFDGNALVDHQPELLGQVEESEGALRRALGCWLQHWNFEVYGGAVERRSVVELMVQAWETELRG